MYYAKAKTFSLGMVIGILITIALFVFVISRFQNSGFKDTISRLEKQNRITTTALRASNNRLRKFEEGFGNITTEIGDVTNRVGEIASGIGTGIEGLEQSLAILGAIADGFERVEVVVLNLATATAEE